MGRRPGGSLRSGPRPAAPGPDAEAVEELYEERAAILEFDAGMTRADAEALATRWHRRSAG